MLLNIHGDINRYYVQTLCMVFFPGATFGENEEPGEGVPEVTVEVFKDKKEGFVSAYVSMKLNDKLCEAREDVSLEEEMSIATTRSGAQDALTWRETRCSASLYPLQCGG